VTARLRRSRDERGATAVLVAVLALVLLGVGAIAIDMGQVYAKRSSLQSAADLAVLAAAVKLDGSSTCTAEAVAAAESYLEENWIDQQGDPFDVDLGGSPDDGDGFIQCTGWKVELWAPKAHVNFGLAKALSPDNEGVDVPARAEAGIYSPATGMMPAFAAAGCDYGQQTLLDNSPGGTTPLPTPDLQQDSPVDTDLLITTLTPSSIELDQPGTISLSIDGNNALEDVTTIAFTTPEAGSNQHITVPSTTAAKKLVTLSDIPASVRSTQETWYVRVSKNGTTWSNALPFRVGEAILECASTVTDGNFGALRLPRDTGSPADWLAMNIATTLDFTLTTYPNPHPGWTCSAGDGSAVLAPNDGTNCVDTDTGLPASDTEAGLLTGQGISAPARLAKPTNPDCGRPDQTIDFGGSIGSRSFNNDTLDCFVADGATTSYQSPGYAGPAVVSGDIFTSPRFFWVPVFGVAASPGGSQKWQIVDFRPAFITGPDGPDEYNGLGFKDQGGAKTLRSVKVVFFNPKALPESMSGGPVMDYLGVGTKVIVLTD
jgi:hypothetical protein